MILVELSLAAICFMGQCHHALVGASTPVGDFKLSPAKTLAKGYGDGKVLIFKENDTYAWSIHRLYTGYPKQRRPERIKSDRIEDRQQVTDGCINVEDDVFDALWDCCSNEEIRVIR